MSIHVVSLGIVAIAFIVFVGIIMYLTGKVNGSPVDEWNEWSEVADNEGD